MKNSAQLRIKPKMYVRHSIMYEKAVRVLLAGTDVVVKISLVAGGVNPIKINYSDYPKSFTISLNTFFAFS